MCVYSASYFRIMYILINMYYHLCPTPPLTQSKIVTVQRFNDKHIMAAQALLKAHSSVGGLQSPHPQVYMLPCSCTVPSINECGIETVSMEPTAIGSFEGSSNDFIEGPSLHTIQKEANAEAWKKIRPMILRAVVENEGMPAKQLCIMCSELAAVRCRKCGPFAFFCNHCFLHAHTQVNLFHVAEEWKVSLHLPC